MTKVGVVLFPGTNCEHDVVSAMRSMGADVELLWHDQAGLGQVDAVILPGGFAHGDYLRPGAIARFSPIMSAVGKFAASGGVVVGICNGFQVLTEAGLLPGALHKNRDLRFVCRTTEVRVDAPSALTSGIEVGTVLRLPINHFEGRFSADASTVASLVENDQVVLRYVTNPNGSVEDIAGICNAERNVVGLMPHPERAADAILGSEDGRPLLASILNAVRLAS